MRPTPIALAEKIRNAVREQESALIDLARADYPTGGPAWSAYLAKVRSTDSAILALRRRAEDAELEADLASIAAGAR